MHTMLVPTAVASASREQSTGVNQMSQAMGQVDQVTQRNAAAAEELASTAEEMSGQAASLQELMGFFHTNEATNFNQTSFKNNSLTNSLPLSRSMPKPAQRLSSNNKQISKAKPLNVDPVLLKTNGNSHHAGEMGGDDFYKF